MRAAVTTRHGHVTTRHGGGRGTTCKGNSQNPVAFARHPPYISQNPVACRVVQTKGTLASSPLYRHIDLYRNRYVSIHIEENACLSLSIYLSLSAWDAYRASGAGK